MKEEEQRALNSFLDSQGSGENDISKNTAGYGIGLFISNLLAESLSKLKRSYGGGIQFESSFNGGSKFSFYVLHIDLEQKLDTEAVSANIIRVDRTMVLDKKQTII